MVIEKIKILGAVLEPLYTALLIQPIWLIFAVNGSAVLQVAPRILIFSIAMDADYGTKPHIFWTY